MSSAMASRATVGLLAASMIAVRASRWDLVAPDAMTLPCGEPPASFNRRANTIVPSGVSESLDARPSRLHTNKFYSNFLVSGLVQAGSVRVGSVGLQILLQIHGGVNNAYTDKWSYF